MSNNFTVEVNWEVLENLNERLLLEYSFADSRFPDLLWKNKYVLGQGFPAFNLSYLFYMAV